MPFNPESIDPVGISEGYTKALPFQQSDENKKTVQNVQAQFQRARNQRQTYDRLWEFFLLYLKGEQLLYRDTISGELVRVRDRQNKRLYSINNQLTPTARSLVGKLTKVTPSYSVVPATAEQDEIYGARVAEAFFEYFRRKDRFKVKYLEMTEHLMWSGSACIQLMWDPDKGRELASCPECYYQADGDMAGAPCPYCQQQAQQVTQVHQEAAQYEQQAGQQPGEIPQFDVPKLVAVTEGDIKSVVHDPRDVFVDPNATKPENVRWVIIQHILPVSEARAKFPTMAAFIKPEGTTYQERGRVRTYNTNSALWSNENLDDHLVLYEYHEKPTGLYPEGRVVWVTNNMVLDEKPSLYKQFGRLPFFWNYWQRRAGEFYAEPFIQQAWHRQKELNELETQIREHIELLSRTKLIIPLNNKIGSDEVTALTGQIIKYNPAAQKPEYLQPPSMPPDVYNRRNMLIEDVRVQGAVTAQEAGVSQSDPNGRAMAIIEAEADQQVGPVLTYNLEEWGEFYRCLLILAQEYYSDERKFQIAGEEGYSIYSFADLKLKEGWDLQLETEDGLSKNNAIRLQQVMDLLNIPQMAQVMTPKMIAHMAKLKIPGMELDMQSSDYAAAQSMVKRIEKGETQVQPQMWDDPNVFSEVCLKWLKANGRKESVNPQTVQIVEQMYQYYTQWAATGQMGQVGPASPGQQGSQPGSDQSAPGGSANNPGNMPSAAMGQPGIADQANAQVKQADQAGEQAARGSAPHEG